MCAITRATQDAVKAALGKTASSALDDAGEKALPSSIAPTPTEEEENLLIDRHNSGDQVEEHQRALEQQLPQLHDLRSSEAIALRVLSSYVLEYHQRCCDRVQVRTP